jgi:hypothetical protein
VVQLYERLAEFLGHGLTAGCSASLTSAEIIEKARKTLPADTCEIAAALLSQCDKVRYGALLPDAASISQAFDKARQLRAPAARKPP